MEIRPAIETDLPEIQAIYAHHVLNGTGTFEEVPPSLEEVAERFTSISACHWAWLTATDVSGVLGYAYYAQIRDRSAYRYTAEDSIYVREDVRGQGVGKALVAQLLIEAQAAGFRQMVAVIGDSENIGSVGMHASLGFHHVGTLRAVGLKFGRWLDTVLHATCTWSGRRGSLRYHALRVLLMSISRRQLTAMGWMVPELGINYCAR